MIRAPFLIPVTPPAKGYTTVSTLPISELPTSLHPAAVQDDAARAEAERLATIERRLLRVIPWVVFGGVILLTLGAGALSWSHLTHVAATNGHLAPQRLLFVFPSIIDGFMVLGSGVVVWHSISDDMSWRTWYAGTLVAATAMLTICLNIEDSTGHDLIPGWALPGIAPALYLLGTELGLNELRLLMRRLRARIRLAIPPYATPNPPPAQSKKEVVLAVLRETSWHVPTALRLLEERGVEVDRSYVYEIKRGELTGIKSADAAELDTGETRTEV
jgi:hypothetical protein